MITLLIIPAISVEDGSCPRHRTIPEPYLSHEVADQCGKLRVNRSKDMGLTISLAHFCDNHGPTSILCTQALPVSCFSCHPRSTDSSFEDLDRAQETAGNGPARPPFKKDRSFDFGDVHDSTTHGSEMAVESDPTAAVPINAESRGGDAGRAYSERRSRSTTGNGNAECVSCSINIPPRVSDGLPLGSPGRPQSSTGGFSSPTLRSKLPVRVYDDSESGYCSDSDEGRTIPQHLAPGSFGSSTSSSSFHEHTLTYITTHAPIDPATYSNLRRAIVRTLSGEQLPRGQTGGPIFFGTATEGYTIAYTFRLPDKHARGGRRLYSLVALAGFNTRKSYRALSTVWQHFEAISEWIAEKVNEEARRSLESDDDGPHISIPPPVSFLTGRVSRTDPFGHRVGAVGLKGRGLVEMTGDETLFAQVHMKFIELLQELSPFSNADMGIAFDHAPERPPHIDNILNGLDRYNPETTTTFQDYVIQQCEDRTYDCYGNLALLKLYQFNPHLTRDDTVTAILTKSLTVFPAPDFSLCLHLLPPHILGTPSPSNPFTHQQEKQQQQQQNGHHANNGPAPTETPLTEAIHKLTHLNTLLEQADYAGFWQTLDSDDLYADLTADVSGFEELMRVRIAVTVGQSCREVERGVLEAWLNLSGTQFENFVMDICGWGVDDAAVGGSVVRIPLNKENEAKGTVLREEVKFEQFGRIVRRAWEEPA
ncbi:MAG: hypothetical protein Q9163_002838 [Psora crenata]